MGKCYCGKVKPRRYAACWKCWESISLAVKGLLQITGKDKGSGTLRKFSTWKGQK
jgi:hypothetical protein